MLTLSQRKALDLTRSVSITANAGSGKTHVLVERCLKLFLSNPAVDPEHVVAITFTDKAAAELKSRIASRVEDMARANPESERLRALRQTVGTAFVGTIHSFCKGLLQAFPLEANVDAEFAVLDSTEAAFLLQESVSETLRDALDRATDAEDPRRNVFLRYGRVAVEDVVNLLLHNRERRVEISQPYLQTDAQILAEWESHLERTLTSVLHAPPHEALQQLATINPSSAAAKKLSAAIEGYNPSAPVRERGVAMAGIIGAALTKEGSIRKALYSAEENAEFVASLEPSLQAIQERLDVFEFDRTDEERWRRNAIMIADARMFLELSETALARYGAKKEDKGALDFDDLQITAVALLKDERVRMEVLESYTHILVDEFQDTNRLQYELVQYLVGQRERANLCIVGDPKQSIYGFRNAEVGVFNEARAAILDVGNIAKEFYEGGEQLDSTPDERRGGLLLAESFRMLPEIAAFVNSIFSRIMREDAVPYESIVAARLSPQSGEAHIELRCGENAIEEAEGIADRLVEIFSRNLDNIVIEENGIVRSPTPKDVTVLLRDRHALPVLEEAFLVRNIPYAVAGGIGFYGRQEVLDLANYLRFLNSPSDDIACAAVLRSPYFLVSDVELYRASQGRREESRTFWETVVAHSLSQGVDSNLHHAVTTLQAHRAAAHRMTVPELIALIQADTAWEGTIAGHPQVAQVRANVEKLIAQARDIQRRGFTSLHDVVTLLDRLADGAEREGQAAIPTDGDVVRVMTIHAAKGLEFPIVVLPFLGENRKKSPREFLDREFGIVFSKKESGVEDTEAYRLSKLHAEIRATQEEHRIFYVACTRARDALLLSTSPKPRSGSPGEGLFHALGIETPLEGVLELEGCRLLVHTERIETARFARPAIATNGVPSLAHINLDEIASEPYGEFFSASHFVTWRQCPSKYVLRYMLGAPEQFRPKSDTGGNGDERIYGTARGTATHAVLARIDRLGDGGLLAAAREEVAQLGFTGADAESLAAEVAKMAGMVHVRDEWRTRMELTPSFVEHELAASLGKEFVHGVLDRLAIDAEGVWHVVDYKTDNVNADSAPQKWETYSLQLKVYAFLVLTHYTTAPRVQAHLWFLRSPDHSTTLTFERSDLPGLREEIEAMLRSITETQKHGTTAARTPSHCPQCGFRRSVTGGWGCVLDAKQTQA